MGLFDVAIRTKLASKKSKKEILDTIKNSIKGFSKENVITEKEKISLIGFKSSILKYNLSVNIDKSNAGYNLIIDGELQQFYVLILLALIIFSILFTYGIGVVFVVAFAFLQKQSTTKFVNTSIQDLKDIV